MTTLTSRKVARAQLKVILKASIETAFAAITGFTMNVESSEPKDTGRLSPLLTIHSAGTRSEFPGYAQEFHRFWVTWYWRRDDPTLTEDNFDDLAVAVRQSLLNNAEAAGYWSDLLFDDDFSETAYLVLDSVQYRTERMLVTAFSVCDNS